MATELFNAGPLRTNEKEAKIGDRSIAGKSLAIDRFFLTTFSISRNAMKRIWTVIGVRDVPGSCKWYQSLFGQPETPRAMIILVKSWIPMELSCFACTSGARTSIPR
jgi:hypothetical protein